MSVQTLATGENRLLNWTTFGTADGLASRVVGNVTFPWNSIPDITDYNAGIASRQDTVSAGGAYVGLKISAASIVTGDLLWEKTLMASLNTAPTPTMQTTENLPYLQSRALSKHGTF